MNLASMCLLPLSCLTPPTEQDAWLVQLADRHNNWANNPAALDFMYKLDTAHGIISKTEQLVVPHSYYKMKK
jgi:hypothetical protein